MARINGYRKLTYIQSNGSQYINTGVYSSLQTSIDITFALLPSSGAGVIIGSHWDGRAILMHANGSGAFTCYWGTGYAAVPCERDTITNIKISANTYQLNNTATYTTTGTPTYFGSLLLCGGASYYAHMKIYECKIYTNQILVRHFIPVERERDNVIGLYDLVDNIFYANHGSGNFLKGDYIYELEVNLNPTTAGYANIRYDTVPGDDNKRWEFRRYIAGASSPLLENYGDNVGYVDKTTYLDTVISRSMYITDSYTARCTTWVYFSAPLTKSITVETDDTGNWYLNENLVVNSPSCVATASVWNFQAGWNKVQCVYTEGGGGDGWGMSPKLYTFAEKMTSEHIQQANITPIPNVWNNFKNWTLNGYTPLEYLKSTGPQHINTGLTTGAKYWIDADISFDYNISNYLFILGKWNNLSIGTYNSNIILGGGGTEWNQSSVQIQFEKKYNFKFGQRRFMKDGVSCWSDISYDNTISNDYLYLFSNNYQWVSGMYSYGKIYRCKIYDGNFNDTTNSVLLRDYIPVIRNFDGEEGMLDLVHLKFYGNNGTGTFICGPVKEA